LPVQGGLGTGQKPVTNRAFELDAFDQAPHGMQKPGHFRISNAVLLPNLIKIKKKKVSIKTAYGIDFRDQGS
jgi:hypothetical protein